MGRYSSDSDNDRRSNKSLKNRARHRTPSSDSSDSRKNRRSTKKSHRRSRSKERYSRSRRSRSSSYISKSRSHRSGRSRDRYRSRRSRSKSYIKEYTSKPKRSSSSSSSSSDRSRTKKRPEKSRLIDGKTNNKPKPVVVDDEDDCVIVDSETIQQINEDKFVPKAFSSSKTVKSNIVIDLNKQTIKVPEVNRVEPDSNFHHGLFACPEARLEKWIKELCSYRQKALQQGWKNE